MSNLRILLYGTPQWRQETINELKKTEEDFEIVGEVEKPLDLLLRTRELEPHMVALCQLKGGGEPGICSHLLLECPGVVILLLPPPSSVSGVSWMVLRKEATPDSSQSSLRAALRRARTFI